MEKEKKKKRKIITVIIIYLQNQWCTKQLLTALQLMLIHQTAAACPANSSQFLKFFCMISDVVECLFGQLSSAVLILTPLRSCAPSVHFTGRAGQEVQTFSALCGTAQQQLKHQSVISIFFLPKPKPSIVTDTMKKINTWFSYTWRKSWNPLGSC